MFDFSLISFLHTVLNLLGALAAILLVILLHELGHFSVARWCGIKIERFSIGFGKVLWSRKDRRGTEYALCLLPLGGYVKMLGEGSQDVAVDDRAFAFNQKNLWVRAAVVAAGPLVNFILAIFLFWVVFQIGVEHIRPVIGQVLPYSIAADAGLRSGDEFKEAGGWKVHNWQGVLMGLMIHLGEKDPLHVVVKSKRNQQLQVHSLNLQNWAIDPNSPQLFQSIGIVPYQPKITPIIANIEPHSPAASLNLHSGDLIVGVNYKRMNDWLELTQFLQKHPDQSILLGVQRQGRTQWLDVKLGHIDLGHDQITGYLGVRVQAPQWPKDMMQWRQYTPWAALPQAIEQTAELTSFNLIVLFKMFSAKISLHTLGGPISIFETAGDAFKMGLTAYLSFIAFVSVSLGFINLLPIPCLDGGYLFFYLIEGLFGRPIPERYQLLLMRLGLLFIILLMVQAFINDLQRL